MAKVTALQTARASLLPLAHALGDPAAGLAILGEGNISAAVDQAHFVVKASGSMLETLKAADLVHVKYAEVLKMLKKKHSQKQTAEQLLAARVNKRAAKPSVEATFHAWLLQQEGVNMVAHTHPVAINRILCSEYAKPFARQRMFPDEVVCCGPRSLYIRYIDPGAELALGIAKGWRKFVKKHGFAPRLILLQNHGIIACGATQQAVLATTQMAVKAAEIFWGACLTGKPVFMQKSEVMHIHNRLDEHYRQKKLNLSGT